jgi:alkylation response protein AidB-like acyl-CoA dehydrogenase
VDFRFSPEDETLRSDVIEFVRREWEPGDFDVDVNLSWYHRDPDMRAHVKAFQKKLVTKGWWTMHWPAEHGGQDASIATQLAYKEAMAYAGAPQASGGGLIAPVLMAIGQDWQKHEFLPKLANADLEVSQGFSEPNAGSDLASLETRAIREGDDYILNGQKIWGTYRDPWVHILVRTDPDAPKHRGITYLLAPLMDDRGEYLPGVRVRTVLNAIGRHRWDELFLDNVRVPARNVIGEENRGWYAAMTTLSFERSNIQGPAGLIRLIEHYIEFCRNQKRRGFDTPFDSPVFKHRVADLRARIEAMRMLSYRIAWMQSQGLVPQKEASMTKFWGDDLDQQTYRTLSRGLQGFGELLPSSRYPVPYDGFLNSRAFMTGMLSISGGTTEIQKNIIAQRGLGLPR